MQCKRPITAKKSQLKTRAGAMTLPCGQCLHCRINKREQLSTRCKLEHRASITGQFWTLTFSEEGLFSLSTSSPRKLVRNFIKALSVSERRHGNLARIRYFGCLEHGADFGRPHVHMLLWNLVHNLREEQPYKEGLPRLRWNIGLWPHGHVDIQPVTPKSINYVCKYVAKTYQSTTDNKSLWEQQRTTVFRPQKPPLGATGLKLLMEEKSRSPTAKWEIPSFIEEDGNKHYLDQTMKGYLRKYVRFYGLKSPLLWTNRQSDLKLLRLAKAGGKTKGQIICENRHQREVVRREKAAEKKHLSLLLRASSSVLARSPTPLSAKLAASEKFKQET